MRGDDWATDESNAAFILHACNSHDALVSALTEAMAAMTRAGANADLNHPQRNAWEHARRVLNSIQTTLP